MKGILLVDMGGAANPPELKKFLARMFNDPFIIPLGKLGRAFLSFFISNTRYKKSWKKYEMIGGSPIIEATRQTVISLQKELGENYNVKLAFSYSKPLIKESLALFINEHIFDVTVIPLYPQSSFSTTYSVENDVNSVLEENKNLKINFIKEFYAMDAFVDFWSGLILNHLEKENYLHPYLLFSAHSIPTFMANNGDTYPKAIEESAKLIAKKTGLNFEFAYQSRMKGKWIGPDTKDSLKKLAEQGKDEILIIPISFVNENLETMFDLDHDIIPFAKTELGIKNISRAAIPVANQTFINLLKDIIEKK
ncbi:MAG: ferrochelatase [Bacteroidota bacterium]